MKRKKINWLIYFIFGAIIKIIDSLFSKNNNYYFFGSNSGSVANGSPKAVYDFLSKTSNKYFLYYYLPNYELTTLKLKIQYYLKSFPIFIKSKYLISSHPPSDFFPFNSWSSKKFYINTWHGFPLKSIWCADNVENKDDFDRLSLMMINKQTYGIVVGSKLEEAFLAKGLNAHPSKFLRVGHPRNDKIFSKSQSEIMTNFLLKLPKTNKIILYAPTWRNFGKTKIFPFEDFDINKLNEFLKINNLILLVRAHNYEIENFNIFSERIINFSQDIFPDVNESLNSISILITDYSSIYFDFLLLDRPVIFIPYDYKEYSIKNGFMIDDYDYWTPGEKILSLHSLIDCLTEIINGNDKYKNERQIINKLVNPDEVGQSTMKLISLLKNL